MKNRKTVCVSSLLVITNRQFLKNTNSEFYWLLLRNSVRASESLRAGLPLVMIWLKNLVIWILIWC